MQTKKRGFQSTAFMCFLYWGLSKFYQQLQCYLRNLKENLTLRGTLPYMRVGILLARGPEWLGVSRSLGWAGGLGPRGWWGPGRGPGLRTDMGAAPGLGDTLTHVWILSRSGFVLISYSQLSVSSVSRCIFTFSSSWPDWNIMRTC